MGVVCCAKGTMSSCSSSSTSSSSSFPNCPTTSRTMTTLILKTHRTSNDANDDDSTTTTTTTLTNSRRHESQILFSLIFLLSLFNVSYSAPTNFIDGVVIYSTDNKNQTTNFREMSRDAFLSLTGKPVEARLPSYHITNNNNVNHHHHHRKKHRGGNRRVNEKETILDGRKHALMQLADPQGLKMQTKCDGQKFKQRVRVDGCLTKVVVNRLCHGTCASYYIPRMHSHSKKLKAAFKSCATCAPSDYDFVDITLDCPGQNPPTATRTIVKVKSCKCREVSISSLYA